jgi:hypothetical protein
MPQTGAAGTRPSDQAAAVRPPPLAAFDPVGEIEVTDRRTSTGVAFDPRGGIGVVDSRAAARAAMADQFAARFGLDEDGPSAAAIADRYDFRYESSDGDPALPAGRRTVTITGHGTDRAVPPAERSLPRSARGSHRAARRTTDVGFRGDRAAMWAVALALVLAFAAAASAHGATLSTLVPLR